MKKSFELVRLYWKQGDDFDHYLQAAPNIPTALQEWADHLMDGAERLRKIASAIEGRGIEAHADTHVVLFTGKDRSGGLTLAKMVKDGLLSEWEE